MSPREQSEQLKEIRSAYIGAYGFDGTYSRLNNRTISQILTEYRPVPTRVIVEGELDGVRFKLTEPIPPPDA